MKHGKLGDLDDFCRIMQFSQFRRNNIKRVADFCITLTIFDQQPQNANRSDSKTPSKHRGRHVNALRHEVCNQDEQTEVLLETRSTANY